MLNTPTRGFRSDNLDLLRAGLALYVLLGHLASWTALIAPDTLPGAMLAFRQTTIFIFQSHREVNPAVLAFIVLSGYCIHRSGLRARSIDLTSYAARRFFRIYPVYVLAIAVGLVAWAWAVSINADMTGEMSGTAEITAQCLWSRITGIAAFVPSLARCYVGNAPLNTVMVEIWLYVAYPVLFLLMLRYGERALWLTVLAIWLAGVAMVAAAPNLTYWWNNSSLIGYLLFWWIGAKATDPKFQAVLRSRLVLFAGLWLALTGFLIWSASDAPLIVVEFRKVVFALIIAGVIVLIDTPTARPAWLSIVGRSGYSLYAFHAPVIYLLLVLAVPWWWTVPSALAFSIATYLAFERPLMLFGRQFASSLGWRRTRTSLADSP